MGNPACAECGQVPSYRTKYFGPPHGQWDHVLGIYCGCPMSDEEKAMWDAHADRTVEMAYQAYLEEMEPDGDF